MPSPKFVIVQLAIDLDCVVFDQSKGINDVVEQTLQEHIKRRSNFPRKDL